MADAESFDTELKDVERVHIERLSPETIALNVYMKDRGLRVFTLGADAPILIKEQEQLG